MTNDDANRTSSETKHAVEAHVPEDVLQGTGCPRTRQLVEVVVQVLKVRSRDLPSLATKSRRFGGRSCGIRITQHIQGMPNLERKGVKDD